MIGVIGTVQVTRSKKLFEFEGIERAGKGVMNHKVLA